MDKRVAVLVIHGMGSQKDEHFADPMITEINQRIGHAGLNPNKIAWKSVYWANITETPQKAYFQRANRDNDLDYVRMRKFIISALGDAASYQLTLRNGQSTYDKIHAEVKRCIRSLFEDQLGGQEVPLVVMAHSLGGHIMSNYIWDAQQAAEADHTNGLNDFESMRHIAGMITFGCNIPLFTFSQGTIKPFDFPGPALSQGDTEKAKWLNFFDPDDILGYPLKSINPAYDAVVDEDIAINVGGWASSWNPMSHDKYWTDNDFTKPVAEYIGQFLDP